MQVRFLPRQIYRGARLSSRLDAKTPNIEAARRDDTLQRWRRARKNGLTARQAAEAVGTPLSTLYRWQKRLAPKSRRPRRVRRPAWSSELVAALERLRGDFPMWGKDKLTPLLLDQGFTVSASTVGRILAHLVKRGVVDPVPLLRRKSRARKWSAKRRFAQRLPKDVTPTAPGDVVQLDTVYVTLAPGKHIKHFTAYDPVAKWTVGKAFNRATAQSAALFLDKLTAQMPFPIRAIQVDGGSEFMAEFETACRDRSIALYVLPPKSPRLNGAVERCNGAWRYEFYASYKLPTRLEELNPILDAFQHLYNHHRPHGALGGSTPARYLQARHAKEPAASHMC